MKYWDWEEWLLTLCCVALVAALGLAVTLGIQSDIKYRDMCHARGGEPVMSASPKLCRDGNTLINVYKEDK